MEINDVENNSEIFDPYMENWDAIEINKSNDNKTCAINRKSKENISIKEIKLSNNPRVNVYCSWAFYKSSITGKFIPRPTFYKKNLSNNIKEAKKIKVVIQIDSHDMPIKFWDMINFLQKYKDLVELGEFENKYSVVSKEQVLATLNSYDTSKQINTIQEFIASKNISYNQLERLLDTSKENSLEEFKTLLEDDNTSEDDWQKFFEINHWIFAGISLRLFFKKGILPQAHVGITDTRGQGAPISDFMCIDKYTTLIELKKHTTRIFTEEKQSTARTNTWSFTSDFIDGISQCLGQKQELINNFNSKIIREGEKILTANEQDTKVIFIIGNYNKEIPHPDSNICDKTKADTFERYRRNCRNIEIITYDELYERARYIVGLQKP